MPTPSRLLAAITSRAVIGLTVSVCVLAGGTGAVLHASATDATISVSAGASSTPSATPSSSPDPGTTSSSTSTSTGGSTSSTSSGSSSTTSIVEGPISTTSSDTSGTTSGTSSDSSSTTSIVEGPISTTTSGSTTSDWSYENHGQTVREGVADCKAQRATTGERGIGPCVSAIAHGAHGH